MAHSWVNALNGLWYNGYVPTTSDWEAIDQAFEPLLNGDGGGTWTPAGHILIEGSAGLWICSPSYLTEGAFVLGLPETEQRGGIAFGDNDYPVFSSSHPSRTRTILQSFVPFQALSGWQVPTSGPYEDTQTVQSVRPGAQGAMAIRVVESGTLSSVTVTFAVGQAHGGGLPSALPMLRVVAFTQEGAQVPLAASGGDINGFVAFAAPADGSAWYDGGAAQTVTYACGVSTTVGPLSDGTALPQATIAATSTLGFAPSGSLTVTSSSGSQTIAYTGLTATSFTGCSGGTGTLSTGGAITGPVIVDIDAYSYQLEVIDERGSNAKSGNYLLSAAVNMTSILDNRPS